MTLFADLMMAAQENARSLSQILAPDAPNRGDSRRKVWLRHYEHADRPRVPLPVDITPNTLLLLYMFVRTIKMQGVGSGSLPNGTRLLLAANYLPFLKPGGFSSPRFSLSPFMVVEQRQWYRLVTTAFLHVDIDHAVSNATNLMISASYLESRLPRGQFAALTASLGLTCHSFYVLLSWSEFWLFGWQSYFHESAIGASGLVFALQVVADHMRGGRVAMLGSGLCMPARFSCWASLAVTQVLVPQASLTGHLCGVVAGLAHVYIPKAVREAKWRLEGRGVGERRRLGQAWAGEADREQRVEVGGRRWSDLAIHAACLCAALLSRALSGKSKNRQHR